MLSITFSFIIFAKKGSIDNARLFANIDCDKYKEVLREEYPDNFDEEYLNHAGLEYLTLEAKNFEIKMAGSLQCYCTDEQGGSSKVKQAEYFFKKGRYKQYTWQDDDGGDKSGPICLRY